MAKTQVMISVDPDVASRAKEKLSGQVSRICEHALIMRLDGNKKSDAPEESIRLQCSRCLATVDTGYVCELKNKFVCNSCEPKFVCDIYTEHQHLKIPGFDNLNIAKAKSLMIKQKDKNNESN